MANKLIAYIANMGKSVTYATIDRFKDVTPAINSFSETNADLFKELYQNIRDCRTTYQKGVDIFKKSKIYEAGESLGKNIIQDIKTGNFYNKEREQTVADNITDSFFNSDDDNFELKFDDEEENNKSSSKESFVTRVENSNRQNTDAVSMCIAKTGEYIVENQKISNNILYTQNIQAFNKINNNFDTLNQNVANILSFSSSVIKTNAENSKTYFEKTTRIFEEQTKLLQQLVEFTVPKPKDKRNNNSVQLDDVLTYEGALNIKSYVKNIQRNIKNELSMFDMGLNAFGDSNPLLAFASSPLSFIPKLLVNSIIPKKIDKTINEFDKSFSGFFGSLLAKFNTMAQDDDNTLNEYIGKIFGFNTKNKRTLDTSKYNKEKVDWNGKAQKALTEVIPTQLSKIIALMSGTDEKVYDYERGSFTNVEALKKQFDNYIDTFQKDATRDMRDEFNKYLKLTTFNSLKEKKELLKDIDTFFKSMYSTGQLFDVNSKTLDTDYSDYSYNGHYIDPTNFKIIHKMFTSAPKYMQQQINANILKSRDAQAKALQYMEERGDSPYTYLFNNSKLGEFFKKDKKHNNKIVQTKSELLKNNIKSVLDNKGHNIFYYLQNMYKELQYQRLYGLPVKDNFNGGKKRKSRHINSKLPNINSIEIPNDTKYTDTIRDFEKELADDESYLKREQERIKKNKNIVNLSDVDEKQVESKIGAAIEVDKIQRKLDKDKDAKDTLIDKLLKANKISDKTKVIVEKIDDISKKPIRLFGDILKTVDQHMYEIIYGKPGSEDEGFMQAFVSETKKSFARLNDWIDEQILKPLRDKLKVESLKDIPKKILGGLGIDVDSIKTSMHDYFFGENGLFTETKNSIKEMFGIAVDTTKDSFKQVFKPITDKLMPKKQEKNPNYILNSVFNKNRPIGPVSQDYLEKMNPGLKTDEGKAVQDVSKNISNLISNYLYGAMPHYAEGSKGTIKKPHVATVGEGEVVLSKENVDKVKDVIESITGTIKDNRFIKGGYRKLNKATNGKLNDFTNLYTEEELRKKTILDKVLTKEQKEGFVDAKNDVVNTAKDIKNKTEQTIEKEINPFVKEVGNELKTGAEQFTDALFGKKPDEEKKKFNEVSKEVAGNISKYAPNVIASSLAGAGVSLLTGAVGGPLLGAAAGAGISLVKHSDKAMEWLFGKTIDGERQGGVVTKDVITSFKKYFPDIKSYGIVGAASGFLPFMKYGPIGGLLLGSTVAVVKNNDQVQKALFGDTGLISNQSKEKIEKMLPKAAAGALIGSFTGPFGLLGNALLGSAVGLATTSDKFKDLVLGKYDPKTKQYENGILPSLRKELIDPIKSGMKNAKSKIKKFLEDDIFNPLKRFLSPIKNEVKHIGKKGLKKLGKVSDRIFEGIVGVPFHKYLNDKFIAPISKVIRTIATGITKGSKFAISLPFKGLGKIGDKMRTRQIKRGYAYDMSAEEQIEFMKNHKNGFGKNHMRASNMFISSLSKQGLEKLADEASYISDTDKNMKKRKQNLIDEMGEKVSSLYTYKDSKEIMKAMKNNDFDHILKIMGIKNLGNIDIIKDLTSSKSKLKDIDEVSNKTLGDIKNILSSRFANDTDTKNELIELLSRKDRGGIGRLLDSKLSKQEAEKYKNYISENYFDIEENNNKSRNEIYEQLNNKLGNYVGKDYQDKIMEHIKNGDIDLAKQLLSIEIGGNKKDKLSGEADSLYKKYHGHTEQQDEITSQFDSILGQTYDFKQKKKIIKLLQNGDFKRAKKYMYDMTPDQSEILMQQLNPLYEKFNESKQSQAQILSQFKKSLSMSKISHSDAYDIFNNFKNGKYNELMSIINEGPTTNQKADLFEFLYNKHDTFNKLNATKEEKEKIRKNFIKEISEKTGYKYDNDSIEDFLDMIKNELKFKDKHYDASETNEEEKIIKEKEMDMNETYHNDIVSLFERTISLLQKVVDPVNTEIRTTTEVYNDKIKNRNLNKSQIKNAKLAEEKEATSKVADAVTDAIYDNVNHYAKGGLSKRAQLATLGKNEAILSEDNTSKLLDNMKLVLKSKLSKDDDNNVVKDAKGNVIEYIKDRKGNWKPNLADSMTRKTLERTKQEEESNKGILSRMGKFFGKKEKTDEEGKPKKKGGLIGRILTMLGIGKGILGKVFGGSLLGKILGVGGVLALPKLIKSVKSVAIPVMSDVYQNSFKPWLQQDAIPWIKDEGIPLLGEGLKFAVKELPDMIAHSLKFTFTELLPTFVSSLGEVIGLSGRNGEESIAQRGSKVIGRHIITGGATSDAIIKNVGSKTTEKFAKKGVAGKAFYAVRHPGKLVTATGAKYAAKGVNLATGLVNKAYTKIGSSVGSMLQKHGINFDKEKIATKAKTGADKLVTSFVEHIKNFLNKLINCKPIRSLIGDKGADKLLKNFVPAIAKEIEERAVKKGIEVSGKLLAAATTGGLLNVAFAVGDFISGFRDAKNVLSITEEPSIGMKISAGFVKALSGLFMITAFIPEKIWVNLIVDYVMPLFGKEDKELTELRNKAKAEVANYNKQNNTNYDVEQYNKMKKDKEKKVGFFEKIKKSKLAQSMANIGSKIGNKARQAFNWTKNKVKSGIEWAEDKGRKGLNWVKNKKDQFMNWIHGNGEEQEEQQPKYQNKLMSKLGIGGGFGGTDIRTKKDMRKAPEPVFPITAKPLTSKNYGSDGNDNTTDQKDTIKNGMVYYSQKDPRWANTMYGEDNMALSACGPTSAAMVLSSLTGKHLTPVDIAQYSLQNGFRVPGVGTSWGLFDSVGSQYGIHFQQTNDHDTILNALKNKQPVIFSGQGDVPFTSGGHFVVGTQMEGDKIDINDPVSLERSKAYSQDTILGQMAAAFVSNKPLDGKLVDNASSPGSASPNAQAEENKPSIMNLFSDFGNAIVRGTNSFFGFQNDVQPTSTNNSGSSSNSGPSSGLASDKIVEYIKSKEGFSPTLYYDSGGTATIGYGSTHGWIMNKGTVTKEEATQALKEEVNEVAKQIKDYTDKNKIELNQNQFDALCSFGYNLGTGALFSSTLMEKLKAGERGQSIADEINQFVHCGSQVLPGLVTRRNEEASIFLNGTAPAYGNGNGLYSMNSKGTKEDTVSRYLRNKGVGGSFTAEQLAEHVPDGKLKENMKLVIDACNKYKVDPALATAIMLEETGGNSAALNNQNNPAGIMNPGGGLRTFNSLADGIDYAVKNFRSYLDEGRNTIAKIGEKYCPVGADNDDGGNYTWVPGVRRLYKQITGKDELDGTVTADTSSSGSNNSSSSSNESSSPSIMNLFSDFGNSLVNGANSFFGFDSFRSGNNNTSGPVNSGNIDKSASKISDDWFTKTIGATVSSRVDPGRVIDGRSAPHFGIDYAAPEGTTIKSPIEGTVYVNDPESTGSGYGNYLVIKDNKGCYHYFGHMQKQSSLSVGDKVSVGQDLGPVGQTGFATGPHVHYEVRGVDGRSKYNPNDYLNSYYNGKEMPTPVGGENVTFKKTSKPGNYVAVGEELKVEGKPNGTLMKLITNVINVLLKISDNTSAINEIREVLLEEFKSKGETEAAEKLQNIKNAKTQITNRNQIINVLKDSVKNVDDPNTDYIMSQLQQIAAQ